MNDTRSTAPDPTALLAQVDEAEVLIQGLRQRSALLNAEVRARGEKIEELQAEISALAARVDEIEKTND